jgi:hypothetical protein
MNINKQIYQKILKLINNLNRMPLFLVTSVIDEGIYPSSFRVIEADSQLKVVENMLSHPQRWQRWLESSYDKHGSESHITDQGQ